MLGRRVIVGHIWRDEATPERVGIDPAVEAVLRGFLPDAAVERQKTRVRPAMEEAIHGTLVAGENGWWIEFVLYTGELNFAEAGAVWDYTPRTAAEVLTTLDELSRRTAPPVFRPDDLLTDPWGPTSPGAWEWNP